MKIRMDNTDLIAEARSYSPTIDEIAGGYDSDLVGWLVEALVCAEADRDKTEAEREEAQAVITEIRQIPSWFNPDTGVGGWDGDGTEWKIINDLVTGRTKPYGFRTPRPVRRRTVRNDTKPAP